MALTHPAWSPGSPGLDVVSMSVQLQGLAQAGAPHSCRVPDAGTDFCLDLQPLMLQEQLHYNPGLEDLAQHAAGCPT